MKKLLIIGAGGFLGSQIVDQAKVSYDVYGISLTSNIQLESDKSIYIDIIEEEVLLDVLDEIQPDFIIHCAAISSEGGCRNDGTKSYKINVSATVSIAKYCNSNNIKLIFTSSDLVFDGENAVYSENDVAEPAMEYGKQKKQAENELSKFTNVVVARIPLLYGISNGNRSGLLAQFIYNCRNGGIQNLFTDEFRTPAFSEDIAAFLIKLLAIEYSGILHLGGKERISRYELGKHFCKYLELDDSKLNPIRQVDIKMDYRPTDVSMSSNLAYSLGFQPREIHVALRQIYEQIQVE